MKLEHWRDPGLGDVLFVVGKKEDSRELFIDFK